MSQDIRDLFKSDAPDDYLGSHQLPENHREEFIQKLKASRARPQRKLNPFYLFKLAAMLVLFMALAFWLWPSATPKVKVYVAQELSVEAQVETVERQYLASIDHEWQRFLSLAKDEQLVERYRKKLKDLDDDYQSMTKQFKANQHNVIVIESLVENLQTRLRMLKEIQVHITILNEKTTTDEAVF